MSVQLIILAGIVAVLAHDPGPAPAPAPSLVRGSPGTRAPSYQGRQRRGADEVGISKAFHTSKIYSYLKKKNSRARTIADMGRFSLIAWTFAFLYVSESYRKDFAYFDSCLEFYTHITYTSHDAPKVLYLLQLK